MTLWMEIDVKNNDLPLAVCESAPMLARQVGVSPNVIYSAIHREMYMGLKSRFVKVEVEEEE